MAEKEEANVNEKANDVSKSELSGLLCIELEKGKYTVKQDKNGQFYALRYGEYWRDLCGDNLVLFLAYEVEKLNDKINAAKNCLVCASIADAHEVCENTLEILNT